MHRRSFLAAFSLASLATLTGCQTTNTMEGIHSSRLGLVDSIKSEPPGDYYIGRRYFKNDYKFWGYVRRPGQPWSTAQMVMLNEHSKLAPDRELGKIGFDNGYEYKLFGDFSGSTVYEPASNGFYPEFVLRNFELRSVTPPNIFRTAGALDPSRRIIAKPY
ncbi:MAG: hypothetical protein EOP84_14890 [Verrucomicrobiaceae bacterium]|nr:MAG: hypothetical protein EOP84_14890 [Verrucomicrobiaceae bacterium]